MLHPDHTHHPCLQVCLRRVYTDSGVAELMVHTALIQLDVVFSPGPPSAQWPHAFTVNSTLMWEGNQLKIARKPRPSIMPVYRENLEVDVFLIKLVWEAILGPIDVQNLPGKQEGGVCDAQGQRSKFHDTPDTENDRYNKLM